MRVYRRTGLALLFAFTGGVVSAQDERPARYEPQPLPNGPEAETWHTYHDRRHVWMVETFLEAFRDAGQQDPRWTADVEKLIHDHGRYWHEYYSLDVDFKLEVATRAKQILDKGCKDPLVYFLASYYSYQCAHTKEARDFGEEAIERFQTSSYSPHFDVLAMQNQIDVLRHRRESVRARKYEQPLMEALARAAADPLFGEGNQRFYVQALNQTWDHGKSAPDDAEEFVRLLGNTEGVDPWIFALVKGWMHVRLGWKARTGGLADEVTEDGWQRFFVHMEEARRSLRQAHRLHPEFPEAAATLVYVVMAHEDEDPLRAWVDRAAAAQLDYLATYRNYMWAMMPRWGGSHSAILSFGEECLETGRFDTAVPSMYPHSLALIQMDYDEDSKLEVYKQSARKTYENFRTYCNGMAEAEPHNAARYRSELVLYAWATGQLRAAAAIRYELGDAFVPEPTNLLRVSPDLLERDLAPLIEEYAKKKAAREEADGDRED